MIVVQAPQLAAVADPLGARHVQPMPERVEQGAARLDLARAILAVDLQGDLDRAGEDLRLGLGGLGLIEDAGRLAGQHGRGRRHARAPQEVAAAVTARRARVSWVSGLSSSESPVSVRPYILDTPGNPRRVAVPPLSSPARPMAQPGIQSTYYSTPRPLPRQGPGSPNQAGVSVLGSNRSNARATSIVIGTASTRRVKRAVAIIAGAEEPLAR